MQPLSSANDCGICQKVKSRVFPIETCTVDMLPPYPNREIEDGYRATVISLSRSEYGGPKPRLASKTGRGQKNTPPAKKAGCLGLLLGTLAVFSVAYLSAASRWR